MRALLLLLCLFAVPALAETGAADREEIRRVIERQLAAIRRDDGAAAFALASPNIRRMFGDPDTFMAMVRNGYQPVYRPREVQFRQLVDTPDGPVQQVLLVGPDNVPVVALYVMERQPDGGWRINGCYLTPSPDKAT
jgi:hypothetical protein